MNDLSLRRMKWMRFRIMFLSILLFLSGFVVIYRAWDLQIVRTERLRRMAEEQYLRDIRMAPKRGTIYDRQGTELAVSIDTDSVWANPRKLKESDRTPAEIADLLSSVLDIDSDVVKRRLSSKRYFVWIKRRITPQQAKVILDMKIPSVHLLKEAKRFYPNRDLAAHILGFADIDGVGIEGLELAFEDRLHGSLDTVPAIRDRRGEIVFSEQLLDDRAAHGDDLYLSIDKAIQHAAQKELELAIHTFEARAGSVVVVDPTTGEILAIANYPTFNPNHPGAFPPSHRRNRAVTDRFEPGSTTKVFTVSGALTKGAIKLDESIDCGEGAMQIAEDWIHDTRKWDSLTPPQILAYSSNIGAAKIGLAMGKASLFRTLHRFGFGQSTGIELPGETSGILRHYKSWYEMDAATISFGQGLSVNALQLAMAMGAIANHGRLMKPILVKRIVNAKGESLKEAIPQVRRQVIPRWAAQLVGDMLTGVTGEGGTAEAAAIDDYLTAGKTGTAQKADYVNGGYSKNKWIASFVGFVPVRRPRLVIAVIIDEPVIAHQGGKVAAPVFRRLAQTSLRHLGVPPSRARGALAAHIKKRIQRAKKLGQLNSEGERAEKDEIESKQTWETTLGNSNQGKGVRIPDLTGLNIRDALIAIRELDLSPKIIGSGQAVSQTPEAGSFLPRGGSVQVHFSPPVFQLEEIPSETEVAAKTVKER